MADDSQPAADSLLKNCKDQYLSDGSSLIDMILAYEMPKRNKLPSKKPQPLDRLRKFFETKLVSEQGLILEYDDCESSKHGQYIGFVKIHAPFEILAVHAERLGLLVPLQNVEKPPPLEEGDVEDNLGIEFESPELRSITDLRPNFAAAFTLSRRHLFKPYSGDTFFEPQQRIQIVWDILRRTKSDPDQTNDNRGIERLIRKKAYLTVYPIHDGGEEITSEILDRPASQWNARRVLRRFWARKSVWYKKQPMELIRSYLGLDIAFYFAWISCYTRSLIILSFLGVLCFVYGLVNASRDIPSTQVCSSTLNMCPTCPFPACGNWTLGQSCMFYRLTQTIFNEASFFYAIALFLWTALFQIFWRRLESQLKWEWHQTDKNLFFAEPTRLEYELLADQMTTNPITDQPEWRVKQWKLWMRRIVSFMVSIMIVVCLLTTIVVMIILRVALVSVLNREVGEETIYDQRVDRLLAALITTSISAVVILIYDSLYRWLAIKLTNFECPRTMSEYEASLTYKLIIFQFANYYGPMFYIAFFKGNFVTAPVILSHEYRWITPEHCDPAGCMSELCLQLFITMTFKQLTSAFWESYWPSLSKFIYGSSFGWKIRSGKRQWEKDFLLAQPSDFALTNEYLELVVQFGFLSMFSVALPLAPLFALINNVFEIRTDARKWLLDYRRPVARHSLTINAWNSIIMTFGQLAIYVNAFILAFTSEIVPRLVYRLYYRDDRSLEGFMEFHLSDHTSRIRLTGAWESFRSHLISVASVLTGFPLTVIYMKLFTRLCIYDYSSMILGLCSESRDTSTHENPCLFFFLHLVICLFVLKQDVKKYGEIGTCFARPKIWIAPSVHDTRRSAVWWHIFAARLAFILVYVVAANLIQKFLFFVVKQTPGYVSTWTKREQYLIFQSYYQHDLNPFLPKVAKKDVLHVFVPRYKRKQNCQSPRIASKSESQKTKTAIDDEDESNRQNFDSD